jgi:hypothetical protein
MVRTIRSILPLQTVLLICAAVPLCGCWQRGRISGAGGKSTASANSYSTTFGRTENPLSENGKWIEGHAAGASLWGNVQTVSGLAYGVR